MKRNDGQSGSLPEGRGATFDASSSCDKQL
jgi:hypothetical protein